MVSRQSSGVREETGEANSQLPTLDSQLKTPDSQLLKHAPKIFTETCKIDWNKPVEEIYNLIRGLAPYPTAYTFLQDKKLKIYKAEKMYSQHDEKPGSFKTDEKSFLHFCGTDGYISIQELQLEGKKKMDIASFLRGYHF